MKKEFVICAAVRVGKRVWRGHRHGHALEAMRDTLSWTMNRKQLTRYVGRNDFEDGFITSKNRFVTRAQGRRLQDRAGIKSVDKTGYRKGTLFSEDLY